MPMTPGLSASIRQIPGMAPADDEPDVHIIENDEKHITNDDGKVLQIEHPDGSITISMDGASLDVDDEPDEPTGWFDNLVGKIDVAELNRISDELLRGIDDDKESRKDWIEARTTGIKLLGLKLEVPNTSGAVDGAPVDGMSRIRHPLLLEAVLRFQANARSEMLPTDGPVKIRDDSNNTDLPLDQLADAFEKDMNHYLTVTASEYYPDTDRMFFMLGFGGTTFKKVYFCPLRNRPVSETVDADDLIVNNDATDLKSAKRVTHRTFMKPSTVKRMQIMGVYRDITLSPPMPTNLDSVQQEKKAQQGITPDTMNAEDRNREIYECYCERDIKGFEHKIHGKASGLDIPYRVTIDVSSKEILSVVRNYAEDDQELAEPKTNLVKYTYVPGMGFYDIGLLHILGNTTSGITAAWRELLDAGMYASFPGFLIADLGARQNTNIFRVPPGGGALVKTGGMPLSEAIQPLPYKEPSATLISLVDDMAQTGMRIGGISETQVGEGKEDMPVGTTLAMIEQAQRILNSVHKRMHAAQAEEFKLIRECFKENPNSFWQRNKHPAREWDEKTFKQAIDNFDLVPQADPNTASHVQRIMKVVALKQLQAAEPSLYDPLAVDTAALQAIGWSNPQRFFLPPNAAQSPPPELIKMQADASRDKTLADAKMLDSQTNAKDQESKSQLNQLRGQTEASRTQSQNQLDAERSQLDKVKAHTDATKQAEQLQNDKEERLFKEKMNLVDIAQNMAVHPESAHLIEPLIEPAIEDLRENQKKAGLVPPEPQQ